MTLKPIVASVFLLGLASSSAYAAASSNAGTQAQLDAMKAKLNKMEAVLQQNSSGNFYQNAGWANRITLSGEANIDAFLTNNAPATLNNNVNRSGSDINLNNANLYLDFVASDWTKGHISFSYQHTAPAFVYNNLNGYNSQFGLDEAYVSIQNFTKSPFFFTAGKQYANFGDYHPNPMIESLPQLLEQAHVTSARVGFVDASGFNASASIFRGNSAVSQTFANTGTTRVQNFAVNAGFAGATDTMGYKLGASYLRNLSDVDYVALTNNLANGYTDRVGAMSAYAGVNSGPFDASVNYVTALQNFNKNQVSYVRNNVASQDRGAKPAAWSVDAGYSFMTLGHQSRVGLGYEGSKEGMSLGPNVATNIGTTQLHLPKTRYQANYTVNVSKYTDLGFQIYNDRDYSTADGGTGKNAITGVVRLGVKFA